MSKKSRITSRISFSSVDSDAVCSVSVFEAWRVTSGIFSFAEDVVGSVLASVVTVVRMLLSISAPMLSIASSKGDPLRDGNGGASPSSFRGIVVFC